MTVEWRAEAGAAMNGGLGLAAIGAAGCKQTAGGQQQRPALIGKGVDLMAFIEGGHGCGACCSQGNSDRRRSVRNGPTDPNKSAFSATKKSATSPRRKDARMQHGGAHQMDSEQQRAARSARRACGQQRARSQRAKGPGAVHVTYVP